MLHHFLKTIDRAQALDFYNGLSQIFNGHRLKELPSLEEYLGLVFKEAATPPAVFDEKLDEALEAHALKVFNERRKNHV